MSAIWEFHKDRLQILYIDQDMKLKSIMVEMRELHGFAMRFDQVSRTTQSSC
jgi:hypothetical protein